MFNRQTLACVLALAGCLAGHAASAASGTVNVSAQANIYAAGSASTAGFALGGVLPVALAVDAAASFRFTSVAAGPSAVGSPTGGATCVFDGPASSGDGNTCVNGYTDVYAANGYSAFYFGGKTMPLVGLFVGATPGDTPAVTPTSDTEANALDAFAPRLQQVFFIGDGRTADSALQTFAVPAGATTLYLGFADAYGFVGDPGYYDDNYGSLQVSYETAAVPEPAAWLMLGGGLALLGLRRPRRSARG